jgi:hypothetical protein
VCRGENGGAPGKGLWIKMVAHWSGNQGTWKRLGRTVMQALYYLFG